MVANKGKFVKDQFSRRHFRRDKVTGSYLNSFSTSSDLANHTVNDSKNELQIIVHDDEDTLMENSSKSEHEEDEQDHSMPNTKLLNRSDLKRFFDEILGSYDRCTENVRFTVYSLALSIKEILNSNGRSWGIMKSNNHDNIFDLESYMRDIIDKHKNSFIPSNGSFLLANSNLISITHQIRITISKKLKSKREHIIHKVKHRNKINMVSQVSIKKSTCLKILHILWKQ